MLDEHEDQQQYRERLDEDRQYQTGEGGETFPPLED